MVSEATSSMTPLEACEVRRRRSRRMRHKAIWPMSKSSDTAPVQKSVSLSGCSQDSACFGRVSVATVISTMGRMTTIRTKSIPRKATNVCAGHGRPSGRRPGSEEAALSVGLECPSKLASVRPASCQALRSLRPEDLWAAASSSAVPDSSRSTLRYHCATACRICGTVADSLVAPSRTAVACTLAASPSATGCESFSVTSSSWSCGTEGRGPPPTLYLVKAAPTDFGMCKKACHVRSARSTSLAPMQLSLLTSASVMMNLRSPSDTDRPSQ
mmetsp:Transcript_46163/g.100763  ORF Transcript_46163/g.100763 Transcript_46163/m.100763 type:complete len:271 (+) Transcript_46163:266-1078(+)